MNYYEKLVPLKYEFESLKMKEIILKHTLTHI